MLGEIYLLFQVIFAFLVLPGSPVLGIVFL